MCTVIDLVPPATPLQLPYVSRLFWLSFFPPTSPSPPPLISPLPRRRVLAPLAKVAIYSCSCPLPDHAVNPRCYLAPVNVIDLLDNQFAQTRLIPYIPTCVSTDRQDASSTGNYSEVLRSRHVSCLSRLFALESTVWVWGK